MVSWVDTQFIDGKKVRQQTSTFINQMILTKALFKVLLPNFFYRAPIESDYVVTVHSCTWTRLLLSHLFLSTSIAHSLLSDLEVLLQGLLPGPASLKAFIGDQEDEGHSKIFKFTDDTKFLWVIKCQVDKDKLHKNLSWLYEVRIQRWTLSWLCKSCQIRKK